MPFINGKWEDPSEKEVNKFIDRLVNSDAYESHMTVPTEIVQHLEQLTQSKINENQLHKTIADSIQDITSIVIPVYNGLHVLKKCINSVLKYTYTPFQLIIVDDGSTDPKTIQFIKGLRLNNKFNIKLKDFVTLFNGDNRGFAHSCNIGFSNVSKDTKYVCILNSDVMVTDHWLTKMIIAMKKDERNVIVNPVTNNTALINLPMHPGRSYLDMNRALERTSQNVYPEIMPTGFCMLIKDKVIDEIDMFDEAYESYGEETDWWWRAYNSKDSDNKLNEYKAVLADDCYVFHERGTSFSQLESTKHLGLRKEGSARFNKLYPEFANWQKHFDLNTSLECIRKPLPEEAFNHDYRYNAAFIVQSAAFCGGMNFINDIVNQMIEENINAKVIVLKTSPNDLEEYMGQLKTAPIFFNSQEELIQNFPFHEGLVFATAANTIPVVENLQLVYPNLNGIHLAQSYEPDLIDEENPQKEYIKSLFGKLPTIFASSWIKEETKIDGPVFLPGVDHDLFHSSSVLGHKRASHNTIMVMLNKNYPFKGYDRAVELCKEILATSTPEEIRVLGVGVETVPECPRIECLGDISQSRMAELLRNEVDLLIDPSYNHSYGMPFAEAIASDCLIACWPNKGNVHFPNAILPDGITDHLLASIYRALNHNIERELKVIPEDRSQVVDSLIQYIEKEYGYVPMEKRISVVTPHMRKHGGPTSIINLANVLKHLGHEVNLVTIYDDINLEVKQYVDKDIPIYIGHNSIPESDVIVLNSDNPFMEKIFHQHPRTKKVMLKLSHNERFKQIEEASLRHPGWDKIITSTQPLLDKTLQPENGWRHRKWPINQVQRVGWYHYNHPLFNSKRESRNTIPIIGTLIHQHPLKGSSNAIHIMTRLKKKYGENIKMVGIGECNIKGMPPWLQYIYCPTRKEMAQVMSQLDIWLGASESEGLGRMALEAMSAGAVPVVTNTGCEYMKEIPHMTYPIGDLECAEILIDGLLTNDEELAKLRDKAYNIAVRMANPNDYINNVDTIFKEL